LGRFKRKLPVTISLQAKRYHLVRVGSPAILSADLFWFYADHKAEIEAHQKNWDGLAAVSHLGAGSVWHSMSADAVMKETVQRFKLYDLEKRNRITQKHVRDSLIAQVMKTCMSISFTVRYFPCERSHAHCCFLLFLPSSWLSGTRVH